MNLDSPGSTWRYQRWLDAGSPSANLNRIKILGNAGEVRKLIVCTLARLPMYVQHHAVEAVTWIGAGAFAAGVQFILNPRELRALPGDLGHVIQINARFASDPLVAHELSHSIRRAVFAPELDEQPERDIELDEQDRLAARMLSHRYTGADADHERAVWIGSRVAEEMRADEQVRSWGFGDYRGHDADELRRHFAAKYDLAAARAASLESEEP